MAAPAAGMQLARRVALVCILLCALALPSLKPVQATPQSIEEELIENAYWNARHRAAALWHSRAPGNSHETLLSVPGHLARFWDIYSPDYHCPYIKQRIARVGDGGKWVCGLHSLLQRPGCVVYSIGSNGETSFEEAVLSHTACSVHTWDHTLDDVKKQAVLSIPGINFHAEGLASETAAAAAGNMMPLSKMLTMQQHQWIDVLKMDIEGGEWQVFHDWYKSGLGTLPVGQLLVEFHFEGAAGGLEEAAAVFEMLANDGFRVMSTEPNSSCGDGCCAKNLVEYSFIKVSRAGHVYSRSAGSSVTSHHAEV